MDKEKAQEILHWIIFDTTPLTDDERQELGANLIMLAQNVEHIFDKYNKETSNDNNQTRDQQ